MTQTDSKKSRDSFEKFWSMYRSYLAELGRSIRDKKACWEKWKAVKVNEEDLVDALRKQINWRGLTKDFVPQLPDPIRWLKREMWTEEIPERKTEAPQEASKDKIAHSIREFMRTRPGLSRKDAEAMAKGYWEQ